MATLRLIEDKDFDRLFIRTRLNARNISMRVKDDGLHVTVPPYTKTEKILEVVDMYREKLKANFVSKKTRLIDYNFTIKAECFRLKIKPGQSRFFMVRTNDEEMEIYCPENVDFEDEATQKLIRMAIIRAMKKRAEEFLPPLLAELAETYGMHYRKVRITGARTRWGSCTSTGTISLSCYLMLVPPHLMDYVMLHELAHTREMNHGPEFWALLDSMTGNMAHALRKELRNYRTSF